MCEMKSADAPIGVCGKNQQDSITSLIRLRLVYKVYAYQVPPVGVARRYHGALTEWPITHSRSFSFLNYHYYFSPMITVGGLWSISTKTKCAGDIHSTYFIEPASLLILILYFKISYFNSPSN